MTILLTGGGTGGSVTPLIALAAELQKRVPDATFLFVGTKHGPERMLLPNWLSFVSISSGKLRRYLDLRNIGDVFRIGLGFVQAIRIVLQIRPSIVITAGGYVGVPVVWAAWLFRIPSVALQPDVRLGLANRLVRPFITVLALGFSKTEPVSKGARVVVTGIPVRPSLRSGTKESSRIRFGLEPDTLTVVILGGGTGAARINDLVANSLESLLQSCQIIHTTGQGKALVAPKGRYHPVDFLTMKDLPDAFAVADLVVSRSGAATLAELAALRKPVLLIPLPDSPQGENAAVLGRSGAVRILDQATVTPGTFVHEIFALLDNPEERNRLGQGLAAQLPLDADRKLADVVLQYAKP